jgi:hypothetical protein
MMRSGITLFLTLSLLALSGVSLTAQTTNSGPNFQEVYDLIKQHAAGVSDADLNRAAVQGLVSALGPKVSLVTGNASTNSIAGNVLSETKIFEGNIAYLRITKVDQELPGALNAAYKQLNATNKVGGLVLDLRYTDGADYAAAAATADLFVGKSEPLLNWGNGVVSSHEKPDAITVPVAVLVNHATSGASEALAATLREENAGLILGSPTAGAAMVTQDFPLKNGERLRIASAPVTLGDGSALSAKGIKPDIDVTVNETQERAFYADAFLTLPSTNRIAGASTNQPGGTNAPGERVRFNEAELVREHKAGISPDEQVAKRPPEPQVPVVSDPALARALDLLKGLAVVRQSRL